MHDHRVGVPKIVLGDFNEWMKGLATQTLSEKLQSIDLRQHLRRRRTYPGVFPVLHLDHIYYEGHVEVVKLELPRTRLKSIDLRAHLRRRRTYPGVFPVLHLDHIYYEGTVEVVKLELPRTRLSLMASDHLPLVAGLKGQIV